MFALIGSVLFALASLSLAYLTYAIFMEGIKDKERVGRGFAFFAASCVLLLCGGAGMVAVILGVQGLSVL